MSPLVQTEGRRRHFSGSPNHATPNPCLTQQIFLDLERTIWVFMALWPCPRMVQVGVSHFPLPQVILIQLHSTVKIHFIATDLRMGNVGSSTGRAAPKHRGEEPQVSPRGPKHQKPALWLWLSGLPHLNPAAKSASTHENSWMILKMLLAKARWILRAAAYHSCGQ